MFVATALIIAAGCGARKPVRAIAPKIGTVERGKASWYGVPYHGRRAASGEIYDMERMTAAHRRWAFGTWVRVYNLDNGSETEVRINDRGPFVHGRIIDLSKAAARSVNMLGPGTAKVKLVVIRGPSDPAFAVAAAPAPAVPPRVPLPSPPMPTGRPSPVGPPVSPAASPNSASGWAVQVASFSSRQRADELRATLATAYPGVRVDQSRGYWRVLVVTTAADGARALLESLRPQFPDAFVLPLKNKSTTD